MTISTNHSPSTIKAKLSGRLPFLLLLLMMMADFGLLAGLALQRHNTFNSSALDLGYHDQVIWNTLQGRPYRFTLYRQDERARFWVDVPLDQIRDPDSLLSYHVEPLLALIAPIYWLWDDVRALLLLQAGVLTLGAWPAYNLGRRRLNHAWAGLAVAGLYLLAPARQAAALSDFHSVALAAPLFLLAFDALDRGKSRLFLLSSALCLIAREDTALVVIALALYAGLFRPRQRRPALLLAGGALVYLYLVTQVVMPYYNGLGGPTYLARYSQFGTSLREMVWNAFHQPQLYWDWLRRPDISAYLGGLLASGGWVALAAPEILVIALPVIALNALANTGWPSSGGAHYSVAIVPFLVAAAALGLARLGRCTVAIGAAIHSAIGRWGRSDQNTAGDAPARPYSSRLALLPSFSALGRFIPHPRTLLIVLALVVGLRFQIEQGVAPFSHRWTWPVPTAHDRLVADALTLIPPAVPVSAQAALYPHLSHRQQIYQFPTIADADYVVLDVTAQPAPLDSPAYFHHARLAMINPNFGPLAAGDGYLLLQRGAAKQSPLIDQFLTFTLAETAEIQQPLRADFGQALRLEGYTLTTLPIIDQRGPHLKLTTYWRALQTSPGHFRPIFAHTRPDGAIVYLQTELPLELYWRPSQEWQAGQLYQLTIPELVVLDNMAETLLAVIPTNADPADPAARLNIRPVSDSPPPHTVDSGRLLQLLELPQ